MRCSRCNECQNGFAAEVRVCCAKTDRGLFCAYFMLPGSAEVSVEMELLLQLQPLVVAVHHPVLVFSSRSTWNVQINFLWEWIWHEAIKYVIMLMMDKRPV